MGPSHYDVRVGRVARWGAPGVLVLGDAAHPMSPVGGQGINMALRDAIVAANHLLPALGRGGRQALAFAVALATVAYIVGVAISRSASLGW